MRANNFYTFEYADGEGYTKGFFNIYQGKSGGIYLTMANNTILLDEEQVNALPLDLYLLKDFDQDQFITFYSKKLNKI